MRWLNKRSLVTLLVLSVITFVWAAVVLVAEGELEYMDEYKRVQRIGKGRQVNFVKKK